MRMAGPYQANGNHFNRMPQAEQNPGIRRRKVHRIAGEQGISEMTPDGISAEIAQARKSRWMRCRAVTDTGVSV